MCARAAYPRGLVVNPAVTGSPLVPATMDMSRLTTAAPAAIEPTAGQAMSRMRLQKTAQWLRTNGCSVMLGVAGSVISAGIGM